MRAKESTMKTPGWRLPWIEKSMMSLVIIAGTTVAQAAEISEQIQAKLSQNQNIRVGNHTLDTARLQSFYSERDYRPLFMTANGSNNLSTAMINVFLLDAPGWGLRTEFYFDEKIEAKEFSQSATDRLKFELAMSNAYIQLANDLATGRTNPSQDPLLEDIRIQKRSFNDYRLLSQIAQNRESIVRGLRSLQPNHDRYEATLNVMSRLAARADFGGDWESLDTDTVLRPGDNHPNVIGIRQRLVDMGVYTDNELRFVDMDSTFYDRDLEIKVRWFQRTSKLSVDGVIGPATYRVLNVPLQNRIRQVEANLERWRLLPRNLGDRYILVDFGQQELQFISEGQRIMQMRVIIGQEARGTPTMVDRINGVRFRPTWTAPHSIASRDLLPQVQRDIGYFEKNDFRLFDQSWRELNPYDINWSRYTTQTMTPYWFQQQPGPHNALGLVRFNLTNSQAIYLHDTNNPSLFNRDVRMASSGCVRVERPLELAYELLRNHDASNDHEQLRRYTSFTNGRYTKYAIERIMNDESIRQREAFLARSQQVPVYLLGTTIGVVGGYVYFSPDAYGQDERILKAMERAPMQMAGQ